MPALREADLVKAHRFDQPGDCTVLTVSYEEQVTVLCVNPRVIDSVLGVVVLGAREKRGWLVEVQAEARQFWASALLGK